MKHFFTVGLFALLSLFLLTGCAGNEDQTRLDAIRERGYLIVGTFGERPPFGYVEADGTHAGFEIYIARRFAYELFGDENAIEFVVTDPASRIEFLRSNRVDLIMASFTVTPEREEQVTFALPYMSVQLGLQGLYGTNITNLYDLYEPGRQLIVTTGSTSEIYFTLNHPEIELLRFGLTVDAVAALTDGRGDALAMDDSMLFVPHDNFVPIQTGIGEQNFIAPAVNLTSTDLLEWLNETILQLRADVFFIHAFYETLQDAFIPGTQWHQMVVN